MSAFELRTLGGIRLEMASSWKRVGPVASALGFRVNGGRR